MNKQFATPWVTLTVCGVALAIFLSLDEGGAVLQLAYFRTFIMEGELWRLITGHLTHYSSRHFISNLLAFAGLGIVTECRIGHAAFAALWFFLAIFISAALLLFVPQMEVYAGISGINYGLVMFLGIQLFSPGSSRAALVFTLLLVLSAVVLRQQAVMGTSVFASDLPYVRVAWQAHLAGMSAAALLAAQCHDRLCFPWPRR